MTTLHLLPSGGHQTAATLKQNALVLLDEAHALRRALQALETAWQGGGQAEFSAQAAALVRQLETQAEALQTLAERLEREVTEWEETDRRGAASLRSSGRGLSLLLGFPLPVTGGSGESAFFSCPILPVFTALSVTSFLGNLPAWLNALLDRLFPPPTILSPVVEETNAVPPGALKRLFDRKFPAQAPTPISSVHIEDGEAKTASATPPAPQAPPPKYDVYYDIPPKAQDTLYRGAACLPTSASMALDYFHAQNADNRAASPNDFIDMLDPGDGTEGEGVGFGKLNDDLAELGYNASTRTGSLDDLSAALKDGPVVVNAKVGLISAPARDITPSGSYDHSMLVKGISADSVVVNDPWSGAEKIFSRDTFAQMWKDGGNFMLLIRPQGGAK